MKIYFRFCACLADIRNPKIFQELHLLNKSYENNNNFYNSL